MCLQLINILYKYYMKTIEKIIIIIIIIIIIFILTGEINRHQGEHFMNRYDYYSMGYIFLAPYSVWCSSNSKSLNKPIHNMEANFTNHHILKDNWKIIRNEALNIYKSGKATLIKNDMFFDKIADNGWKKFYIKWYGPITNEASKLCPKTVELISKIPEIKLAMFSILEAGSKIPLHAGPFKGSFRYHLGLNCPKGAYINIDGNKYEWKNGKDILFDDTFMHEVQNNSNDIRIILFCDIERKMKSESAKIINSFIIDNIAQITSRANDKLEKQISILNGN
jgi:beta-hydroxylase